MMRKKISWLYFMTVFLFFLNSCVHDEIYSYADPSSKEYSSKSLWKEDEKYIKNVMKIYFAHEQEIRKTGGTPFWDYANTMDRFDESFLLVPVVENGKVISVLQVPRYKNKVYFRYTYEKNDLAFFQGYIFAKHRKAIDTEISSEAGNKVTCVTKTYAVWLPYNENDPDPESGAGYWSYTSTTKCDYSFEMDTDCTDTNGDCGGTGGYDYGGGNPDPEPEPEKTPCEKAKDVYNNTAVKSRYDVLKTKVGAGSETGYGFKMSTGPNGQQIVQTHPLNPDAMNADKMKVSIYPTTFGYSHTHLDKPVNSGNISVKIFSPKDINAFITILRNAIANGVPLETVFAGMVASDPDTYNNIYQLQYIGDGSDLPNEFTDAQLDKLKIEYSQIAQQIQTDNGELTHTDLQKLLNETLKKMNLKNTVLFKIEGNNNTVKKVNYSENGYPTEANCS